MGAPKKRKVATKTNSYERYGEILFQKVASGYLLHFAQDGSSKNALEKYVLRKNDINPKIGKMPYTSTGTVVGCMIVDRGSLIDVSLPSL